MFDFEGHEIIPFDPEMDLEICGFDYVEEGVRNLVKVLWKHSYKTVCSCAGHENDLSPYPWIVIPINLNTQGTMFPKLVEVIAKFNMSLGENGQLARDIDTWSIIPIIAPSCGFAIYLEPTDINVKRSTQRISELRKSANNLAFFLEKELISNQIGY